MTLSRELPNRWRFAAAMLLPLVAIVAISVLVSHAASQETPYDLVILGGRVLDPESGLDSIRNVGIKSGKIAAITENSIQGKDSIDANGLVVAPGFIDLHEHGQEPRNYEFQARDGVTTSLELEAGTADVDAWYAKREGHSLINHGVSIGHIPVRMLVMKDPGSFLPTTDAAHRAATPEELQQIDVAIEHGLQRGALAVGMGINYTAAASHGEIVDIFKLAAAHGASVHVHLRYSGFKEPTTGLAAIEEVIAAAASTGAPLHVVHITSMGAKDTPRLIEMVKGARKQGLDVTTEAYPYPAGSTRLESALFDPGWQERGDITYKDLQLAKTGERLTAETFEKYRKEGGTVIIFSIPETAVRAALADPIVMVASDGMPLTDPKPHPRGQATFARVLGHYVREEKTLDLMTAVRKMTLMPAQRLEKRAPVFHDKGRIRVGADADITVFDPAHVIDKATFEDPIQPSEGIPYVLVNGTPVVRNSQLVRNVFPGKSQRAPITQ
jgi:N-acyl-D-aspartate/D-glutamate deacylase